MSIVTTNAGLWKLIKGTCEPCLWKCFTHKYIITLPTIMTAVFRLEWKCFPYDSLWTPCVCVCVCAAPDLLPELCRVFVLHGAGWLYSIRRRTKCVVIHFLLATTKLAIWLPGAHSVCGSGPTDPLHCSCFGPSGLNITCMWVKDSARCTCVRLWM